MSATTTAAKKKKKKKKPPPPHTPCIGLGPCPYPLYKISLSLRLCLPCLPRLLRLFLGLSLSLGPFLSLCPLSLCSFGLRSGSDISGGLFRCSLFGKGFLSDSRLCLGLCLFTRLGSEPGDLRLLLRLGLSPCPCPM